ncbi:hypothetical protein [Xanthomonas axonopodis]|uniref:hypothetical protein n=1 Tax=Xanthomonas axonopodis TaxID=53413 RepID=UPI001070992C|nr:hypothetical protein [Xanthomonas axonopodis]
MSSFLDIHAVATVWSLEQAGVSAELIETFFGLDQVGAGFSIQSLDSNEDERLVALDLGRAFRNQQLFFFRGDYTPRVQLHEDDEDFLFVRREKALHQNWLLQLAEMEGRQIFVNRPSSAIKADNKMFQLMVAGAVGLSPPKTYFGSSVDRAKEVFKGKEKLVIKPLLISTHFQR